MRCYAPPVSRADRPARSRPTPLAPRAGSAAALAPRAGSAASLALRAGSLASLASIACALGLAFTAAASAGCVKKPEMHLDHAEISGVQLATMPPTLGIVMTAVIQVTNPNGYDVAVRAVRGQLLIGTQYPVPIMFQAPPPDGLWLPAGQTTPIRVPVTVPIELALAVVQQGFASPTIPYRFVGAADVTASHTFQLEKDNYAVDETGTITRDQMLAVIPATIQASPFFPH